MRFVGWVKGHADNPYNNLADELAVRATPQKTMANDAAEAVVDMPAIWYSSTTRMGAEEFISKLYKSFSVNAWTDGACGWNPGPGGWGFVLQQSCELNGGEKRTTNNRIELMAAIIALETIPSDVTDNIFTVRQRRCDPVDSWMENKGQK